MKDYTDAELAQLLDKDIFHMISEAADSLGLECYVVGGYVRDIFLEKPSDDIDCVVVAPNGMPAPGIAVAKYLKKKLGKKASLSVFKNFGTAQVKVYGENEAVEAGSLEIEFVGARKESYQRDSRKPIVEDGTLEDDQNRRDFTINAMAICLNKNRFGELVDPFGGIRDLAAGIIRTPLEPEQTYSDDPLRMLRAIRFAVKLSTPEQSFTIVPESLKAMKARDMRPAITSAMGVPAMVFGRRQVSRRSRTPAMSRSARRKPEL